MDRISNRKSRFTQRRIRNSALAIAALLLIAAIVSIQFQNLYRSAYTTGYILIAALVFLASFNLRKKLTFLPQLGTSAFWMQLHIYIGLASVAIFVLHVGLKIPQGIFEQALAALYLVVAGSGIYGLYATRVVPRKLTQVRTEPLYESIPRLRNLIAREAQQLVEGHLKQNEVITSLYENRLASYFLGTRNLAYALAPSSRYAKQLVMEIEKHERYLTESDRAHSKKLAQLVRERDDLDYHRVMQGRLKCWLIMHVAFTYSLLLVSCIHGIMAHAFAGGLR